MPLCGKVRRRLGAVLFMVLVAGMFLGSLHAARRTPRKVRIGGIRPVMSFSKICVEGLVASRTRILDDGTRFFLLADETGTLPLFLYHGSAAGDLQVGSMIAATGHLGLGTDDQACLRVPDAGHIEVLGQAEPTLVHGRVIELSAPPPGSRAPCRMVLDRPEGRIDVVHWFAPPPEVAAGDRIEARGTLGFYRGRMQLKVRDEEDIRIQADG
jgi:hypothetical protein